MRRRAFILGGAALGAAALPRRAPAQERRPRIVVLHSGFPLRTPIHLLIEHLRLLGYEEGRSASIAVQGAEGDPERLRTLVARLVADPPDVTVAFTPPAALAVKAAGLATPVVFAVVADPVRLGLVESLRRPAGNFTGLTTGDATLVGKRVELLIDSLPGLRRVAILWSAVGLDMSATVETTRAAAEGRGIETVVREYLGGDDLAAAFADAKAAGAQAVVFLSSNASFGRRKEVAELALTHRLPSIHAFRIEVEDGALMSLGLDLEETYRRAAALVDKILKGAKPAELPVEEPTRFTLAVNLKTAAAFAIVFPPALLARADEVIE
jgi:putative ABC transport system substrate-binding protein